jgi:hypothetical protein
MKRCSAAALLRLVRTLAIGSALALAIGPANAGANDVLVIAGGGTVRINGDQDANDITITESGGSITITGNGVTTVDGKASVTITPPPAVKELKIRLLGGDDNVTVDGVPIDDLDIKDKQGNNTTTVQNGNVKKRLKIRHGPGDDTIRVTDTTRGSDDIKPDGGDDTLDVEGGSSQRAEWHTQSGADTVSLVATAVGRLNLNTGAGDDDVLVTGSALGSSLLQGASGANCLVDADANDFGRRARIQGFDQEACNDNGGSDGSGRAVTLDFDTGELPAGTVLCLDEIVAGGCLFVGPECLDGGSEALHLHDWIAIESIPDVFFEDPDPDSCGHGIVRDGVLGCGPDDDVPPCVEE